MTLLATTVLEASYFLNISTVERFEFLYLEIFHILIKDIKCALLLQISITACLDRPKPKRGRAIKRGGVNIDETSADLQVSISLLAYIVISLRNYRVPVKRHVVQIKQ